MRHPLDPLPMHKGAAFLGTLVGRGLIDAGEANAAIAEAAQSLPSGAVDGSGLQCRLAWAMRDEAAAVEIERAKAARDVRAAVVPLIQKRATARIIQAAAVEARGCLSEPEAKSIALNQAIRMVMS